MGYLPAWNWVHHSAILGMEWVYHSMDWGTLSMDWVHSIQNGETAIYFSGVAFCFFSPRSKDTDYAKKVRMVTSLKVLK